MGKILIALSYSYAPFRLRAHEILTRVAARVRALLTTLDDDHLKRMVNGDQ